ncbi:hypothetical protein [Pseudomonas grandcourensis]|uniref:hypothetical protein n=1 Tax=Pseudomonas grandcourensis TaxID=3136736 RepID=UPI0032664029
MKVESDEVRLKDEKWQAFLEGKVVEQVLGGRMNGRYTVENDPEVIIQLRDPYLWWDNNFPGFFMLFRDDDSETELVLRCWYRLEQGGSYPISEHVDHVDACFLRKDVTSGGISYTVPKGTFHVRFLEAQAVEGFFDFEFKVNFGSGRYRGVSFRCDKFDVRLNA